MKESKPYQILEEEDGSCLTAQEPVAGAYAYAETWQENSPASIPGLPQSWDELLECIAEGEEEFKRGECIPWEEVVQDMRRRIHNYGA